MSRPVSLTTYAATVLAGFALAAFIMLSAEGAFAQQRQPAAANTASENRSPLPNADLKSRLDAADEIAMLDAVQVALNQVGDGSTYVWYRANGRLSGLFQPTTSFRDGDGKICRHLKLTLTSGTVTRSTEGVACRIAKGHWALEG